jgi:Ca-activated chloride channel family protein
MCLCFLSFAVSAQSGKTTRPRVVASPTPQIDSPVSQPTAPRPPLLKGDTKTATQTNPAPATAPDAAVEEDDEIIRVETNLVSFPVSVLDRDGRFISGLQKGDFQIFENGVEQKIENFATVQQPFTVILLIDVSLRRLFRLAKFTRRQSPLLTNCEMKTR